MPSKHEKPRELRIGRWAAVGHDLKSRGATYAECDPKVLLDAVYAVTNFGDAITFGLTSDGGAFYVGVLSGGEVTRFYLDSLERLEDTLQGLVAAVND